MVYPYKRNTLPKATTAESFNTQLASGEEKSVDTTLNIYIYIVLSLNSLEILDEGGETAFLK